nr:dephospho-CoA kinase [uncultured Selenomonas sp.]
MNIIGLTGGIACGKSTVSKILRSLGAKVIDADAAAHALSQPKQPLYDAYVARFGAEILTAQGTLDRAAIGRIIFKDPNVRAEIDALAHPLIQAAVEQQMQAVCPNAPAVVLDVPLLFEAGWEALTDEVWVVSLPEDVQLVRLMERDPVMTEAEARARIAAQMPLSEKRAHADVVIDNSGTKEDTLHMIERIWRERVVRAI